MAQKHLYRVFWFTTDGREERVCFRRARSPAEAFFLAVKLPGKLTGVRSVDNRWYVVEVAGKQVHPKSSGPSWDEYDIERAELRA